MLILNLKNYIETSGKSGEKYYEAALKLINENPKLKELIYFAPPILDLLTFKNKYPDLNFMAPHVDNKIYGKTTGWVNYDRLLDEGIEFALLNHSEHRIGTGNILEAIPAIQAKGLKLIVCCESKEEAEEILVAKPYSISYEAPELIGTLNSVTNKPEEVISFIEIVNGKTLPLIGAGVADGNDVKTALKMGAKGVLLATAFVQAEDPYQKLIELVEPFLL